MILLAIDAIIVVLLGAALAYGWFISRRVTRLMEALHDLEPLFRSFSEAVDKSQESVKELRHAAEGAGAAQRIEHRVEPRMSAAPAPAMAPMMQAADPETAFASRRAAQRQAPVADPVAPMAMAPMTAAPAPQAPATIGLMQLGANKSDLVRSFFETSRSRAV